MGQRVVRSMAFGLMLIGLFAVGVVASPSTTEGPDAPGPDVTLQDIPDVWNFGVVGDIRGYAIGSWTCNIGDQNLRWANNGTPGLAMNAYRLHDGRMMQIGMSWVKHACCAAASQGCGSCNGVGGSFLGVGCRDVYSASYNGGQSRLGPRSGINSYSGAFTALPGGSGNATFRRLQVREGDMNLVNFPGSMFFVEGVYAATDDAAAGNWHNNATYKRVNISGSPYNMVVQGNAQEGTPAIRAWRDHGGGIGVPDPSVNVNYVDLPGEGRFWYASKATSLGGGLWRYDYAVFNLSSDKAAGGLRIPIGAGVDVSNVGFHAPPYHSGEPYNNDAWMSTTSASEVTWSTAQTHAQNANANAVRWGTMYNFWFTANSGPEAGEATLDTFKPHTPGSVQLMVDVPSGIACYADCDETTGPGVLDIFDFLCFGNRFDTLDPYACDCDQSTGPGVCDIFDFICFGDAFAAGCP